MPPVLLWGRSPSPIVPQGVLWWICAGRLVLLVPLVAISQRRRVPRGCLVPGRLGLSKAAVASPWRRVPQDCLVPGRAPLKALDTEEADPDVRHILCTILFPLLWAATAAPAEFPDFYKSVDRVFWVVDDIDRTVAGWQKLGMIEIGANPKSRRPSALDRRAPRHCRFHPASR